MGKFESYPEADSLNDSDITLYNKNSVTHKITFSRLVSLIKNKIAATGLVTSITTGVGLVSGTITSSGLIKCKLKSETPSSLSSTTISTTANRQYAVGVDKEGNLSVNVPWQENSTYQNGTAINIVNNTINVVLDDTYTSTSTVKAATANAVRKAYNNVYNNSMRTDGSNASRHVHFPTALTVGIIDPSNPISIGDNSVCFGYENTIGGSSAFASGVYTEAKGFASHSEGHGTNETNYTDGKYQEYNNNARANIAATATGAHVEGYTEYDGQSTITGIIQANGNGSHAEGCAIGGQGDGIIIASGKGAHAEGYADSIFIGGDCATIASGNGSHAEGIGTESSRNGSHAEGIGTRAIHDGTHTEGYDTTASGWYSHAEGRHSMASGETSHAEGYQTAASGTFAHTEGQSTQARGDNSHAEGSCGIASGVGSHVEGGVLKGSPSALGLYESQDNHTKIVKTTDSSFVSGKTYYVAPYVITPKGDENPKTMGWLELQSENTYIFSTDTAVDSSKTYYNFNVIFGNTYSQTANGYFAHAEGNYTVANGHYSHAEGQGTKANGSVSHAEGRDTQTSGECTHAEGYLTTASGFCSHAEGARTTTSGDYSHGEGYNTTASGKYSHVEGFQAVASGTYSHAEGFYTTSNASYAHAEGYSTKASGSCSHAGGAYVTAAQKCQLAQGGIDGKFNSVSDYGRGVFCVSPNTLHYDEDKTLSFPNGVSITAESGVSLTINLNGYAMYILYWVTYSGEDDSVMNSGIHYITTSKLTNSPFVQDMLQGNIIDSVSPCSITLSDTHKYMFHLMRIL